MGRFSGKYAAVDGHSDVTNWSVSETSTPVESRTSATRGGTRRSSGVLDGTGSVARKGGIPLFKPGILAAFKGYSAPDTGVYGTAGVVVEGNVYATSIVINMNFEANEDVNHTSELVFDQGFTIGSDVVTDPGPPLVASICPCKIEYGDSGVEVEIEKIANATLTFTQEIVEYIDSETNCTTGRDVGPLDWNLDIVLNNNVRQIPIQSDERLKVWINATQFFILEFGHLSGYSDFNHDPSTGEIIKQTMNWMMQSHKQSDPNTIGAIYWPDDAVNPIWPPEVPPV